MLTVTEKADPVPFTSRVWSRSRLLVLLVVAQVVLFVAAGVVLKTWWLPLASAWIALAIPVNMLYDVTRTRVHLTEVEIVPETPSIRLAWLERDAPQSWTGRLDATAVQIGRDHARGSQSLYLAFRDGARPVVVQHASDHWPNDRLRRVFAAVREAQGLDVTPSDREAMAGGLLG